MTTRPMEVGDASAWVAMRDRPWPHHGSSEHHREIEAFFAGSVLPTLTAAFVAIVEDEAVGFIELALRAYASGCASSPVPYVEGWFVKTQHCARGVGTALMRAAEQWARDGSFSEIASDAQLENDGSLRAHLGCGFTVTSRTIQFRKPL